MKVYIVTAGEYSDYHIDAVFTNETMANQYANMDSDRQVEEYETDIESVIPDPNKLIYHVSYDFEKNKITTLYLTSGNNKEDDWVNDITLNKFVFYVSPHDTLNDSIRMFGMNSDWLLKIAQDRFYMYCDAHDTSRNELLQKKQKRDEQFYRQYPMYRTSVDTGHVDFRNYLQADKQCNDILKSMIAEGVTLPTGEQLRETYREIVRNVAKENVIVDEHDELR